MSDIKSTPQWNSKSTPLALSAQVGRCNQYVSSDEITKLVINIYKTKGGRGTTYTDLIETGLAKHKAQAQDTLKYHLRKGTLFTFIQKSTQIDPTGVAINNEPSISKHPLSESVILQTLEGYVLPLLPEAIFA